MRCLDWAVDNAIAAGVDVWVHAGDLYDRKSTPTERLAASSLIQRMAEHAPVVIVRGNHDAPGDIEYLGRLQGRHDITAFERPGVVVANGIQVLALPHFDRGQLAGMLPAGVSIDEENVIAGDHLAVLLKWCKMQAAAFDGPTVLVSHLTVAGSMITATQPIVGHHILSLNASDLLDTGADYIALGHIHLAQDFGNGRIRYPGSINRFTFGESEPKGYVLVEIDGKSAEPRAEWVEVPARSMLLIEGVWHGEPGNLFAWSQQIHPDEIAGADVRLRLRFREDQQTLVTARIPKLQGDFAAANTLKIDTVMTPSQRVRSAEIASATTPMTKLSAYWATLAESPTPDTRERQLIKLATLIQEAEKCA
jgi:exonuclease SbcD